MTSEYNQDQGLTEIADMIRAGELRKLPQIDTDGGEWKIKIAANHVASARKIAADDPEAASTLVYSAARKALTGLLQGQGLAVGSGQRSHHLVAITAVRVQLVPPHDDLFASIEYLRSERNTSEYALVQQAPISQADLQADIEVAQRTVDLCRRLIRQMGLP